MIYLIMRREENLTFRNKCKNSANCRQSIQDWNETYEITTN